VASEARQTRREPQIGKIRHCRNLDFMTALHVELFDRDFEGAERRHQMG
jgi:hypothetical protein